MRNWFAWVQFSALGGRVEKFVTLCGNCALPLNGLSPCSGGLTGFMPARRYREASRLARRCRTRLHVLRRGGLYFRLRPYRGRWGLLAGPLIFLTAVNLFGNLVWSIRWLGVEPVQQKQIEQLLYDMDIYQGSILTQEKIRSAEKELPARLPDFTWLSLNFGGGRLVVEAMEACPEPVIEPNEPRDLVASADGVIVSMETQEGIALKRAGQTVAEGEVLIRAGREDRNGRMIPVHAKGRAVIQAERVYQCVQPMEVQEEWISGPPRSHYALRIAGHRLQLGKDDAPAARERLRRIPLTLGGFCLPATLEERFSCPVVVNMRTLSREAAREAARFACIRQLYSDCPDAVIVTEQAQEDWQPDKLCYTLRLCVRANFVQTAE